jgi:stage II sporulation protein D
MSQWGAYGYAQHGWGWRQILAHYYVGTQVARSPVSRVRVLIGETEPRVTVTCAGGTHVTDRTGRGYALPAGAYVVGPRLRLPVGHRRVPVQDGDRHRERSAVVTVTRALRSPVVFGCAKAAAPAVDGHAYRGLVVLRRTGKSLTVVNSLALDDYVRGVVAGEMPHRWSLAALEAQAVASRSYAVATRKPAKAFDLYADTRSQVYGGVAYETPRTDAAVAHTSNDVLTWHGRVATTYFFSTSGGRTANVQDVWPKLGDVPYLRSVPDPYDAGSPHHSWGPIVLDAGRVANRLHVPAGDLSVERTPSGHVAAVRIGSRRVDADTFRTTLGLASTWFDVGELSLAADRAQVRYGGTLELSASAVGLGRAELERRVGAGAWKRLKRIDGPERLSVEPQGRTVYRLSVPGVRGPVAAVGVVPLLDVEPAAPELLAGSVSPVSRGAVTVLRKLSTGWKLVARPHVDGRGEFRAPLRLHAGEYRITVEETTRFAAATATVRITPRLLSSLRH